MKAKERRGNPPADTSRHKEAVTLGNVIANQEVHVELNGNREALVDGCRGIVEYNDSTERLNITGGQLRFSGRSLQIACMTEDSMILRGYILSVEYCS